MFELMKGDCLELMKRIPDGSVDVVISDIPYGIDIAPWDTTHANKNSALGGASPAQVSGGGLFKTRGKPKNGWSQADRERPLEFQVFCESWLEEIYRITKPCSPLVVLTGRQNQHRFTIAAENLGFVLKDTLTWDKIRAPARAQSVKNVMDKRGLRFGETGIKLGNLAPVGEPIVYCFKPYGIGSTVTDCFIASGLGCVDMSDQKSNIIKISSSIRGKRQHETEKPVALMEILIKMLSRPEHVVLDMFMGSGTTGVACANTGRKFIGIEMDEKYFEIAKNRVESAYSKSELEELK